ncbi:hypothetical protein AAHC03_020990 [Spirometra sp. Aus1]
MTPHTRKLYLCEEKTQDKGPSVDSNDLDERIAARRLRIENRVAQQNPEFFDQKVDDDDDDTKLPEISKEQVELSMQRIVNLCRNGNAFISNIKVACDARENLRRLEEDELTLIRTRKLEAEAKAAEETFKAVTEKWDKVDSLKIPQELHDLLEEQKKTCAAMIDEKNRLIHEIHLELKAKDDHFVKELKKRSEDVEVMVERMESQMKSMQRAYTFELQEIEERDKLLEIQNKDWDDFIEEIRKKQVDYLKERQARIEELDGLIHTLRTNHCQEFNALKLRLTTEVQQLETDLQQMKAAYQLNLEKLEYNFQVLKRRDEENTITKSKQKRKITHLQDQLNIIRTRSRKMEEQMRAENEQLSEDYKKRMEMFRELQKKSKFLIEAEDRNYRDIWLMNENEMKIEAQRLLNADRVITEQHLGLKWEKPDISFMDNCGPPSAADKTKQPESIAAKILRMISRDETKTAILNRNKGRELPTSLRQVPPHIIGQFLDMLCFEPEYLMEEKMKRLLKPMSESDQKLIRLDAVLNVLNVHNEEQLDKLFTYFLLPYETQPTKPQKVNAPQTNTSSSGMAGEAPPTQNMENGTNNNEDGTSSSTQSSRPTSSHVEHVGETAISTTNQNANEGSGAATARSLKEEGEEDEPEIRLIDPVDVSAALRRFATDFCAGKGPLNKPMTAMRPDQAEGNEADEAKNEARASRPARDDQLSEEDRQYWMKYVGNLVSESKQKMWSALLKSLDRYRTLLKSRSKLIVDNEGLRSQNAELKHLLEEYLRSKVSLEMEVPPGSTLSL